MMMMRVLLYGCAGTSPTIGVLIRSCYEKID
jgi:hypothetical protein